MRLRISALAIATPVFGLLCTLAPAQDREKYMELGRQASKAQNFSEAEKQFNAAIREAKHSGGELQLAESLDGLASVYRDWKKYSRSEALYKKSLHIRETILGPWHPNIAQNLDNLADTLDLRGKHEQAEPLHKRARAIREQAVATHPDVYVDGVAKPVLPK
ncbi:MAG: tetratricopeptide repeat protein [Bryobacteraceae bacterium]